MTRFKILNNLEFKIFNKSGQRNKALQSIYFIEHVYCHVYGWLIRWGVWIGWLDLLITLSIITRNYNKLQ
jgi:hypothetical protein